VHLRMKLAKAIIADKARGELSAWTACVWNLAHPPMKCSGVVRSKFVYGEGIVDDCSSAAHGGGESSQASPIRNAIPTRTRIFHGTVLPEG
jgi:hypothetical protein